MSRPAAGIIGLIAAAALAALLTLVAARTPAAFTRIVLIQGGLLVTLSIGGWFLARAFQTHRRAWQNDLDEKTRALREAVDTHQMIVDNTDAMVFTLDADGRYLTMNRYGLAYLGAAMEDIHLKFVEEHLDAPGAERFRGLLAEAGRRGELTRTKESMTINGRERYVDIHLKVFGPANDRPPFFLVIFRDVTEQKAMDEWMWQTEKLASLGTLAAGVAHEVNNPLGVMMGFCEILLERVEADSGGHRELSIIYDQCQHCKKIVEGLLNFTRLSDIDTDASDPLTALRTVIDVLRGVLENKNIEVMLDLPDRLPPCTLGSGPLQQVFSNLIGNAMDAMPEGGTLNICGRLVAKPPYQGQAHGTLPPGPEYVEIDLRDTGLGIAPEHMKKIFDPFFTTKPVGQGTGLGLSVVYGLIREHGGTITCQSPVLTENGEESGSCFTVRLPPAGPPE